MYKLIVLLKHYQLVANDIVFNQVRKTNMIAIIDGFSIDTATMELVNESLVVVGSHTRPASVLNLSIENCNQLSNLHVCELKCKLDVVDVLLHNLNFLK